MLMINSVKGRCFDDDDSYTTGTFAVDRRGQRGLAVPGIAHPQARRCDSLAQLGPKQMGIVYHTDISGTISAAAIEETPVPTALAMLHDVVDIYLSSAAR